MKRKTVLVYCLGWIVFRGGDVEIGQLCIVLGKNASIYVVFSNVQQ